MKLALAQLEIEPRRVEANRDRAIAAVERAAADGADLVAFPELFTVGYIAFDRYEAAMEPLDGETISRLVGAVNGVGRFDDAELLGRSAIYDPWGTTVAGASDDPGLVTATVDPDRVDRVREEFPVLKDRR